MRKCLGYKGRSIWKGFYIGNKIKDNDTFYDRRIIITKSDIGKEVYVYNGKRFLLVKITRRTVGYRLGQFVFTKRLGRTIHIVKRKKKKKK
jgi:ribosomal protein S19